MNKRVIYRKCAGCGEIKPRDEMIKLTKDFRSGNVFFNPDSLTFGRSVYLCYNHTCIEKALKKSKLNRVLKTGEDLKGILDEQFKS